MSAVAALTGSTIGGLTSLTASWLSQRVQFRSEERTRDLARRETLYRAFIEEASRWYAHAFEHGTAEIANMVKLYALVSRMRVLSSPRIVEAADRVVRVILETYRAPNKTFRDLDQIIDNESMNPLRDFSDACREELMPLRIGARLSR